MLRDRPSLRRRLRGLTKLRGQDREHWLARIEASIAASQGRLRARIDGLPVTTYPADLPITQKKAEIAQAIADHQVVIVCGETGSGKTTQLPKICLELGRGTAGIIGHTQPRRIAARSVAARIAEELDVSPGAEVGYKVRFGDHVKDSSYIKLMTDGILLAEIQHDRLLLQYDTLIIDEAHERGLNIDFILGYLKQILPKRPDLKLIITSATIDPDSFARYFDAAPVIEVSGRGYPVEMRYRPLMSDEDPQERDLQLGILEAVDELARLGRGDILIFLPGERQIRETAESLRKHHPKGAEILPLYARLSVAEQNRVFQAHRRQRIVLATNVAETSLTVPGIKYVIDCGSARISRYSVRAKVQRLPIERVSQASARQRAGRCGRTAPGTCIRLYSEEDFESRPLFTEPEVRRTNLASVILQMSHNNLGAVESFPFLDPPEQRLINDGYKLLEELGAVDNGRELTEIGRQLARLPVDPRLARMILAAERHGCLREVVIIVSALAAQDPRERPLERREAADEKHRRFQDQRSDFLSFVKLWEFLRERQKHLSKSKFRRLCREHFISVNRVFEWWDIHGQLCNMVSEMRANQQAADFAAIHRALLHGLLGHIGFKEQEHEYQGPRNGRFYIFPGSGMHAKAPKWVMAAELVETTRLYARTVARIEPGWVVEAAGHLIKREYFEPHWQPRAARVSAFERITLYGLVLVPRRRIDYGPIAPSEAREMFIREALVAGRYRTQAEFFLHNHALVAELMASEAKVRRRDILVDEEELYRFYDERIPARIYSGRAFEKWLRSGVQESKLYLSRSQLTRQGARPVDERNYPHALQLAGTSFPLSYHFEPGDERDGVTLTVPLALLNKIDATRCEWLVPGLLEEKVVALLKALPKSIRRNFVPAPDYARACAEAMAPYQGVLTESLSRELLRITGVRVAAQQWRQDSIADHLRMRFEVVDDEGKTVSVGRDLGGLQGVLADRVASSFTSSLSKDQHRDGITIWDFGDLDEPVVIDQAGFSTHAYPGLVDQGDSVALRLFDTSFHADQESRKGIRRLYLLNLHDQVNYLRRSLPGIQSLCLHYRAFGSCDVLKTEIIQAVFGEVFLDAQELPKSRAQFQQRLDARKGQLLSSANKLCELLSAVLSEYHTIRLRVKEGAVRGYAEALSDIREQLDLLIYDRFIQNTPYPWLVNMPRYLKAINVRLDKLQNDPGRDRRKCGELSPYWQRFTTNRSRYIEEMQDEEAFVLYRWMLEEFRVSLFAQPMKTTVAVSTKRLKAQWERVEKARD
jgi:ATP-dependent helicase HrpA